MSLLSFFEPDCGRFRGCRLLLPDVRPFRPRLDLAGGLLFNDLSSSCAGADPGAQLGVTALEVHILPHGTGDGTALLL